MQLPNTVQQKGSCTHHSALFTRPGRGPASPPQRPRDRKGHFEQTRDTEGARAVHLKTFQERTPRTLLRQDLTVWPTLASALWGPSCLGLLRAGIAVCTALSG